MSLVTCPNSKTPKLFGRSSPAIAGRVQSLRSVWKACRQCLRRYRRSAGPCANGKWRDESECVPCRQSRQQYPVQC